MKYKDMYIESIEPLVGEIDIIDIRREDELFVGVVPTAKHIEMNELAETYEAVLNKDTTYYIYCHVGMRSLAVCQFLAGEGYSVVNLAGGHERWLEIIGE